ncbi:MAG: Na(+)-translocating NADH-quinone reductase subunit A [Paludibacteraceae bacterium]|nr:Na(+)-translocating NADH-quinone reductase subunit A [Paludibacteraceae bacterium]
MNKTVKLCRGLDIPMEGVAAKEIGSISRPSVYRIVPDHYAVVPKLLVREGDEVKAGDPLFHHKQFADMLFASPVSGKVKAIVRGERRKVLSIDIEADSVIEYRRYESNLGSMSDKEIKHLLLDAGVWSYIKQRPYDCIANPEQKPKAVFISTFDSAPLAPDYDFIVKGHGTELQAGISALAKIAGVPVNIGVRHGSASPEFRALKDVVVTEFSGPHPAGNVGVQINHVNPVNKGEVVWTVNIQDVLVLGRLFTKGIVDMQKLVALTGPLAIEPKYYRVLPGMPVSAVFGCNVVKGVPVRYIAGNVLSGHQVELDESISAYDNHFTAIDEGSETNEFMGWAMPRFDKFSAGRMFFTKYFTSGLRRIMFGKKEFQWDARLLGGHRAIIVSGEYDKVFPMDIYPEYLIKAMIAGNLDKMEQLGAYEVAPEDFALCEFVCTSKMPLQAIVREALDNMRKELE